MASLPNSSTPLWAWSHQAKSRIFSRGGWSAKPSTCATRSGRSIAVAEVPNEGEPEVVDLVPPLGFLEELTLALQLAERLGPISDAERPPYGLEAGEDVFLGHGRRLAMLGKPSRGNGI